MIVHIEFKNGKHKFIPLSENVEVKEYHIIVHTEVGTEIELRSNVEKISITEV